MASSDRTPRLCSSFADRAAAKRGLGAQGKVLTDFAGLDDRAFGIALQADGGFLAAGSSQQSSTGLDFALARYSTAGELDEFFGSGGKPTTDFAGSDDEAFGVALEADGKIVLAGASFQESTGTNDFALARHLMLTPPEQIENVVDNFTTEGDLAFAQVSGGVNATRC